MHVFSSKAQWKLLDSILQNKISVFISFFKISYIRLGLRYGWGWS